jgi:hypothetical protein
MPILQFLPSIRESETVTCRRCKTRQYPKDGNCVRCHCSLGVEYLFFARSAPGNLLQATRSLDRRSAPELTQAARFSPIPAGIDATWNRPKLPIQDRVRACASTLRQTSAPRSVPWTDRRDPAVRGAQAPDSSEIELPWLTSTAFYRKMCSSGTIQSTHSHSGPAFLYDNRKSGPVRLDSRPGKESSSENKLRQRAGRRNQRGECRTGFRLLE